MSGERERALLREYEQELEQALRAVDLARSRVALARRLVYGSDEYRRSYRGERALTSATEELMSDGRERTAVDVVRELGDSSSSPVNVVSTRLAEMAKQGRLVRVSRGRYVAPPAAPERQ